MLGGGEERESKKRFCDESLPGIQNPPLPWRWGMSDVYFIMVIYLNSE